MIQEQTGKPSEQKHHNDIYGDLKKNEGKVASEAIPAATVVLIRDQDEGMEILMLKKNSKIAFGGMWVFPGGKIDAEDSGDGRDSLATARFAAARETEEEAGITTSPDDFVYFAHWTPPASTPRRYATWFFASKVTSDQAIQIDGGEILEHEWMNPADALKRHTAGEIDLAPPTWITLYSLSLYARADKALEVFADRPEKIYETRVLLREDGIRVAMWAGDHGYESKDPDVTGDRHRLVLDPKGFEFQNTVEEY
ncbi:MAG: NUDIX hydrolase [Pseudomonadales bacterium]|jgi:8-oxo-dGTP pyrophosphatase MutT (NUDIX family)